MASSPRWSIAIGSDCNGHTYKEANKNDLNSSPYVKSIQTSAPTHHLIQTAYPHIAISVATAIRNGKVDRGILICGTRLGVAIAANKVQGIRAMTAHDSFNVERGVLSDNAQILCLGQQVVGEKIARRLVAEWLGYFFDQESQSAGKVKVIEEYEVKVNRLDSKENGAENGTVGDCG